ncbi:hypothetical protein [Parvibium lacunae]|uniref:Outer membrane protein assembly factor BamE n=1 Tax=Parvibium lacunae TaxID=1888893 RepID=A0A368L1L5_9BURK|nr:hypothetical protein [Parvibium lacunae]RCS56992.1 hypothetical protein DU000_09295 [Parvibium lacunae]
MMVRSTAQRLAGPVRGAVFVAMATLLLTACVSAPIVPGSGAEAVRSQFGQPTQRHVLPSSTGAVERWEYAYGPFGLETWMIDLDRDQRVVKIEQVLQPAVFARLQQAISTGFDQRQLAQMLGKPAMITQYASWTGPVWVYRFRDTWVRSLYVYLDQQGQVKRIEEGNDIFDELFCAAC